MINHVSTNPNAAVTQLPSVFSDFTSPQSGYFLTPPEVEKEMKKEKSHKLGISIATTAIVLGFGVLALMKGVPKGAVKKLDGLRKFLENRALELSQETKSSKMADFYQYSLNKVENLSEYLNSLNNATSFKDILFGKLMKKTRVTAKAAEKITAFFEKLSRRTVLNGYENAHYKFNRMFEVFGAADNQIIARNPNKIITINGKTLPAKEWLKEIAEKRLDMSEAFNVYFGKDVVNLRYKNTKKVMSNLEKKVWDLSLGNVKENYKNRELYDTYLSQAVLEKDKSILKKTVKWYRDIIVGTQEKSGQLNEVLKIYEQLLSPQEFEKLKRYSDAASKKLDRAIVLETDKFFDKLRDLTLGSAPTDVLSMVTGLSTVGVGLTRADDNAERISVSLKYGIPALSTIATAVCLSAALVSGRTALFYTALSGFFMNRAGKKVDDYIEQKREEKSGAKNI